jgi:hypothetical protein
MEFALFEQDKQLARAERGGRLPSTASLALTTDGPMHQIIEPTCGLSAR